MIVIRSNVMILETLRKSVLSCSRDCMSLCVREPNMFVIVNISHGGPFAHPFCILIPHVDKILINQNHFVIQQRPWITNPCWFFHATVGNHGAHNLLAVGVFCPHILKRSFFILGIILFIYKIVFKNLAFDVVASLRHSENCFIRYFLELAFVHIPTDSNSIILTSATKR